MRWQMSRRSSNIEDRRGMPSGVRIGGGGGLLVLALVIYLAGGDPSQVLNMNNALNGGSMMQSTIDPAQQKEEADFSAAVLGSTEDVWGKLFRQSRKTYESPVMVLYSGGVESGCGFAQSAVGPFYCPLDHKLYLDLGFFQDLEQTLNAPGDFARAYVIAHEVGHHVQTLLGKMDTARGHNNAKSVKIELQADCYAGIWAHHAGSDYNLLEQGDVDEALNAASSVGDDKLQQASQGYVVPDSFTHGSAAQRHKAFETGFKSGSLAACD
jgi:predicted metalloprotease